MNRKKFFAAMGAIALATGLTSSPAHAQPSDYPVGRVSLVTHSTPGGGTDVFLRDLTKHLSTVMKTSFTLLWSSSWRWIMLKLSTRPFKIGIPVTKKGLVESTTS